MKVRGIGAAVLAGLLMVTLQAALSAQAAELTQAVRFAIEPQDLDSALLQFSQQSGISVSAPTTSLAGKKSSGVNGEVVAEEALRTLLQGTGLSYKRMNAHTVAVGITSERDAWNSAGVSGEAMQLAQAGAAGQAKSSADAEADQGSKLEEVVVTAQKRKERLKDVPISIAVLDGKTLDSSTAQGTNDTLRTVPSMTLSESVFAGFSTLTLRGVGGYSASSPVAFYLDSAPFGLVNYGLVPDSNAYDMERVEVLRGPQGTLYGANAENGVVRVITHDADMSNYEFKSRISAASTQHGEQSYRGDAAINVPIVNDVLGARLVLGYQDLGGWIDRPNNKDGNTSEIKNARLRIRAKPASNLEIGLSSWISRTDFDNPALGDSQYQNVDERDSPGSTNFEVHSARVEYQFPAFTLTSVSSYLHFDNVSTVQLQQFDPTNLFGFRDSALLTSYRSRIFSEELLLNSAHDSRFQWTMGAFYRNGKDRDGQETNPVGVFPSVATDAASKSNALFGQINGHFTPTLDWTAGLRYFRDSVTIGNPGGLSGSADFTSVTPKAALTWHPSQNATIYGSYGEGFRSGAPQNPFVLAVDPSFSPRGPDKLHNYEIGTHISSLDGRLNIEGAVYYLTWNDIQQNISVPDPAAPGGYISATVNQGSASGPGVDLAISVEPVHRLMLSTSIGWNRLRSDVDVFSGGSLYYAAGDRLNNSPEVTASASAGYSFPLAGDLEARINISGSYVDPQEYVGFGSRLRGDAVFISNARFEIEKSNRWTTTLFVDNLGDANPVQEPYVLGFPSWSTRTRPRTVGLQLELKL